MTLYQYMTQTAEGDCDTAFDNKEDAIKYARENGLKVVEEEYEYSDSYPVEGADFTDKPQRYKVILQRETREECSVYITATDAGEAISLAKKARAKSSNLHPWTQVSQTIDFARLED